MNELRINQINDNNFVPKEGQRGLMCSNKESFRCPSLCLNPILSKDTLDALEELGDVLKSIRKRMVSEGYEIIDGVVTKIH